uniref:TLC domain-containing protein n=1 Tax=Monopterus albus TaxID=43700 RepID=A0A3Q3IX69_MONAL
MDPFSQLILTISVTSFFTFQCLFHKVSPWVSMHISSGFLGLSDKQKVEWNSRTVSTFHALLVGLFCLYIFLFDDAINEDPVWGDPTLVKTNVAITTGYLISDLLLIFYYWKAIGDKFFVIHHLAALYAYYYVLVSALWSNSRICRQDGKETTKGEQLCCVGLSVLTNLANIHRVTMTVMQLIYCSKAVSAYEVFAQIILPKLYKHTRKRNYGWLKSSS